MKDAIVLVVLRVPDDYDGQPVIEAAQAIQEMIPETLRARAYAAIDAAAHPFIILAEGIYEQQNPPSPKGTTQ